jgi:hypothetical protein
MFLGLLWRSNRHECNTPSDVTYWTHFAHSTSSVSYVVMSCTDWSRNSHLTSGRELYVSFDLRSVSAWFVQFVTLSTGWTIGVLAFDSRRRVGIFLFTTASRTALGPTQPAIQWVPGALSLCVKRPEREAEHSNPPSTKVKEWVELYLHSPIRLYGLVHG